MNLSEVEKQLATINFRSIFLEANEEELKTITEYAVRNTKNIDIIAQLIIRIASYSHILEPSHKSLLYLLQVLYHVEGTVSYLMNVVIYALLLRDYDRQFSVNKYWKLVSSFDDLYEIRLATREAFLSENGYGFFSEIINRELRNAIAHQNFEIMENGVVHIIKKRHIKQKYSMMKLLHIVNTMSSNMMFIMKKIHGQILLEEFD